MDQKTINVAMIGQGFMGKSHSNAWSQVNKFFTPPITPVMHTVYGMEAEHPEVFAKKWGWANASTNWEETVKSPEIGLVDIVTPNFMHAPPAKAAIMAGKKCVTCEKPIAGSLDDARAMAEASEKYNVPSFVWLTRPVSFLRFGTNVLLMQPQISSISTPATKRVMSVM